MTKQKKIFTDSTAISSNSVLSEVKGGAFPILFSTPMIKAILSDKKTMTRRIIKGQDEHYKAELVMDAEIAGYDKEGEMYPKLLKGLSCDFDNGEWVVKC